MSEIDKQGQSDERATEETRVVALAQIDEQMKDAYQLLKETELKKRMEHPSKASSAAETSQLPKDGTAKQSQNKDQAQERNIEQQTKAMTLEEKRRTQREHKMTIEERRRLQRENPKALTRKSPLRQYLKQAGRIDGCFMALLIAAELLNIYISFQMYRFFHAFSVICSFLLITLLLLSCLFLTAKKRRLGFICSSVMAALLLLGGLSAYRVGWFCNRVFANTETETVMLVAKKDSDLSASSDFNNKRLAVVKSESKLNELVDAYLADQHKAGYLTKEYPSYQAAYESLMNKESDFMVISAQAKQRLSENETYNDEHIRILFEHKQSKTAAKPKEVDIVSEPFNVLLIGVDLIDSDIDEQTGAAVNLLLSVNPKTKKILMQTIPVEISAEQSCANHKQTKLAYAGSAGGIDCSISTLEQLYGITINYYIKINLRGITDTVDALGGITINNDIAFCTAYQNRYQIEQQACFHEGENRLDGAQAMGYSQVKELFTDGNLEQQLHQGEIINGIVTELKQPLSISKRTKLLKVIEKNLTSNFNQADLFDIIALLQAINDQSDNIAAYMVEGEMRQSKDEITDEALNFFYPKNNQSELVKKRIQDVMEGK